MKKTKHIAYTLATSILLSGCASTNPVESTTTGGVVGSTIGGTVGWLIGGRSMEFIGNVTGAVAGSALGYTIAKKQLVGKKLDKPTADSTQTTNTIQEFHVTTPPTPTFIIDNISYEDGNSDGKINKGETCQIYFEVTNTSNRDITDAELGILSTDGSKNFLFSQPTPNVNITSGNTIRYTTNVYCRKVPKDLIGEFTLYVTSASDNQSTLEEYITIECAK